MLRIVAVAAALAAAQASGQPLSMDDALRAADAHSPRLAAQRHAVGAAVEQTHRAAELPDPRLRFGIENLPVSGADRFRYDRDFMTSRALGFSQEFPNADKRAARSRRAEQAHDLEQGNLAAQRSMLHRDVAMAWFDVHFAERARGLLEELVGQLAAQAELAAAGLVRGRQTAADSLTARAAVEQARDRVLDQERVISRAKLALAVLVGEEAKRPLGAPPDTAKLLQPRESLVADLHAHPHLRVFDRREELARAEVAVARASRKPDWALEVGYGHRRPAFDNMLSVMVAIDLPWQAAERQDRDIATRLAELEQARAQREDARRVHEAELRGWLADYDTAGRRLARYREVLAPLARDRAQAALAAYRGGRAELSPALDAARNVTDTSLAELAVESERARAWANLSYLYPHEGHR